jgi:hypothetical protein
MFSGDEDFAAQVRRHYDACVSYAGALMGRTMGQLDNHQLSW